MLDSTNPIVNDKEKVPVHISKQGIAGAKGSSFNDIEKR